MRKGYNRERKGRAKRIEGEHRGREPQRVNGKRLIAERETEGSKRTMKKIQRPTLGEESREEGEEVGLCS